MVGHVLDLAPGERRELLTLLTQERADLQTDGEVLAELSETLRRQLSLGAATDLAEGFRRRMIRVAEELGGEDHSPGHYDFVSDRTIAGGSLDAGPPAGAGALVRRRRRLHDGLCEVLPNDVAGTWLREAALAASAAESDEAAARHAADAAKQKSSAEDTAARIATDVASIAYRAVRRR